MPLALPAVDGPPGPDVEDRGRDAARGQGRLGTPANSKRGIYNGWRVAALAGPAGTKSLGAKTIPQIVTRGWLAVPGQPQIAVASCGKPHHCAADCPTDNGSPRRKPEPCR